MGGLAFVNPAMALGALAIAIPVAIHLLTRRTPVLVTFPTLRFLMEATANQSRLFRVRHYLLLCIRTLIILLLLAAFLRPILTEGTLAASAAPEAGVAAIILVDASLSMGHAGHGISPFAKAVSAAEVILDQLGANDVANVIFADALPRAAFDEPTANRAQLRSELARARHTPCRADLDAAIALALKQLDPHASRSREIHFVSDFQRTNWAAVDFSAIPYSVKTVFVSAAGGEAANLALTAIKLRPANPAAGENVEVVCSVANYGPAAVRVPVTFTAGGGAPFDQEIPVDTGATATATFRIQFERSGFFEATANIGDDALREDNTRHAVVRVSERFPILILTDAPADDRNASHRFLAAALDPFSDGASVFLPETLATDAFDRFAANRAHAVIVTQAGALGAASAGALAAYLKDGGRAIYFIEGPADRGNLDLIRSQAGESLKLPFALLEQEGADGSAYATLASANYDDPMLKKFRDTSALAELHFYSYFGTRREEAQGQVLLKYDNGHIALAGTTLGLGSLLLANFSPGPSGGDLPKSTAFVPLVHEMIKALGLEGGGNREFAAGYPCATSITLPAADTPVRFTNPAGEAVSAAIDMSGLTGAVFFNETRATGFYRAFAGETLAGSIPVNTDPRESHLESLSAEQLSELARRAREDFLASTGTDAGSLRQLREGLPLWPYFLAAALAFLAVEQGFAFLWRR